MSQNVARELSRGGCCWLDENQKCHGHRHCHLTNLTTIVEPANYAGEYNERVFSTEAVSGEAVDSEAVFGSLGSLFSCGFAPIGSDGRDGRTREFVLFFILFVYLQALPVILMNPARNGELFLTREMSMRKMLLERMKAFDRARHACEARD